MWVTKNKVKTGFFVAAIVYGTFSATTAGLTWPLIEVMGQNETLYQETVSYVRIELIGIIFASLGKFLMLVIIMHQWNGMIYMILLVRMVASSGFDYGLASKNGADLGAMGIAYSSVSSNVITFLFSFVIVWMKLKFTISGRMF